MESVSDNSSEQDTDPVPKENEDQTKEEPAVKKKRPLWRTEENCPRLAKVLQIQRKPEAEIVWDEGGLVLGQDLIPRMIAVNFLVRMDTKPTAYENSFPPRKRTLLSKMQVKYVQDIMVARDTVNLGMGKVIRVVLHIGQTDY